MATSESGPLTGGEGTGSLESRQTSSSRFRLPEPSPLRSGLAAGARASPTSRGRGEDWVAMAEGEGFEPSTTNAATDSIPTRRVEERRLEREGLIQGTKSRPNRTRLKYRHAFAEGEGFEPSKRVTAYTLSRRAH